MDILPRNELLIEYTLNQLVIEPLVSNEILIIYNLQDAIKINQKSLKWFKIA